LQHLSSLSHVLDVRSLFQKVLRLDYTSLALPKAFALYSYSSLQDLSHLVTYLLYAPSFNQSRAWTTSKGLCLRFMRHLSRMLCCSICSHSVTYLMYAHLLEKSCALPTTNRLRLNFFGFSSDAYSLLPDLSSFSHVHNVRFLTQKVLRLDYASLALPKLWLR